MFFFFFVSVVVGDEEAREIPFDEEAHLDSGEEEDVGYMSSEEPQASPELDPGGGGEGETGGEDPEVPDTPTKKKGKKGKKGKKERKTKKGRKSPPTGL